MQKKTIFLLQETKEANDALAQNFIGDEDFEVVGCSSDGISAISMIADKRPKVLITELVISGYDGISVISRVKELGQNIKIVVLTALCSDDAVIRATHAGADYFLAKPYKFSTLKERLLSLFEPKVDKKSVNDGLHQVSLEEKISKIFINVGIPPHIKGYSFLREGVKMAVEEPEIINNITKKLYPSIGEKYNTTASKVERAIRHAIEVAWNRGRIESINNILGVRAYIGAEKPTNGEFIALVADKMLLEKA
jgi:two-component system response regulator (stage 0 sporulation protein A)